MNKKKAFLIGGAAAVALVPAALGLAANSSLSSEVPLQVSTSSPFSSTSTTTTPTGTTPTLSTTFETTSPTFATTSPTFDDHGGDRPRGDDDSGHHGGDDDSGHHGGSGHG